MKFNDEIKKNIIYVFSGTTILSVTMILFFKIIGYFSVPVLIGAFIGTALACLNFYLLALTLHKAVSSDTDQENFIKFSYSMRSLFMLVAGIVSVFLLKVNPIALLLPYMFPRIAIMMIKIIEQRKDKGGGEGSEH